MCGIAGIVGTPIDEGVKRRLVAMGEVMAHRGPDSSGIWNDTMVGFSHKRLSIFDLSEKGNQPMISPCGRYVIVYNGEVYNWLEIRQTLKFDKWKSATDTETILQAYMEHGPECLQMFNGMFAIVIWDMKRRELFMARDRVGIKPLYYGFFNKALYFGSEPKVLFAGGYPKEPNRETIHDFLRWGLIDHDEKTFFNGVNALEPGTYMTYTPEDGKSKQTLYWDLSKIVA
ncbi:MAG: hypothetical protein GY757_45270 [bacterium]|nr:hypothetical protein [bacterium]